jgi:ATP:corrinoid adenosyltransferase
LTLIAFFYCLVCEQWRKELIGGGVLVVVNLNLKREALPVKQVRRFLKKKMKMVIFLMGGTSDPAVNVVGIVAAIERVPHLYSQFNSGRKGL